MFRDEYTPVSVVRAAVAGRRWVCCGCLVLATLCGASIAEASEGRASRFEPAMVRGRQAMADGLYELAERHFRRAIDAGPDAERRGSAAVWAARAALSDRRPQAAIQSIREVFDPAHTTDLAREMLFWLAVAHVEAGDAEEAESVLAARARMDDAAADTVEVQRLQGRIRSQQGRWEEAAELYEAIDGVTFGDTFALENLLDWGEALAQAERADEAEVRYRTVVERAPESREALEARLRLARMRLAAGDRDAVDTWTDALLAVEEVPPEMAAEAWLLRAEAALMAEEAVDARRAIEAARATEVPGAIRHARLLAVRIAVAAGEMDEARTLLAALMTEHPDETAAGTLLLLIADTLYAEGKVDEAVEAYRRHVDSFGPEADGALALRGKAWALWARGEYGAAADAFERLASCAQDEDVQREALFKVADAYFAAERMSDAAARYLRFVENFPDDDRVPAALLQAAEARLADGDFDHAGVLLKQVEREAPAEPWGAEASLRRGRLEERRGRWTQAVHAYDATIERYAGHEAESNARLRRAWLRYRLGRVREALEDFQRLVDQADAPARIREQAFFMRGWALYLVGEEERAVAICKDFIEGFPESVFAPDVLFWLGEYAFNRGEWAEAEAVFLRLNKEFPDHALADRALYWAGRSAIAGREFVRGIEHFGRLVRAYPESPKMPDARFAQGGALSDLGRYDEAILVYQEILRQFPDGYHARRASVRIGDCHFTLAAEDPARYEDALRSYDEILARDDVPVEIRLEAEYKMGRCLERMDRIEAAFERYMNVVYGHLEARGEGRIGGPAWFARAGFRAGSIRERAGDWREAISVYRRVASAGGTTAEEARGRIQRLRRENWRIY